MPRRWNEILMDDHQATEKVFTALEQAFAKPQPPSARLVADALEYFTLYLDRCHNHKEEDHLFPLIEKRGIPRQSGPLAVMLAEHEESRRLLAALVPLAEQYVAGRRENTKPLGEAFAAYSGLLKQHFWKENDILYPMALRVLRPEDEATLIAGIEKTEASFGNDTRTHYLDLAARIAKGGGVEDLSMGLDRHVLAAILNTLPIEISFVDADDTVAYFSHENLDKIFPRSRSSIGMKVQQCHPQKSVHMVNAILQAFKAGKRDLAEFWIDFTGRKIHIRYFPVRDEAGRYLGCLETVQDITSIQRLDGQRRLLDDTSQSAAG